MKRRLIITGTMAGTCSLCRQDYPEGTQLVRIPGAGWVHQACSMGRWPKCGHPTASGHPCRILVARDAPGCHLHAPAEARRP